MDKNKESKKQFDEPISMDFQTQGSPLSSGEFQSSQWSQESPGSQGFQRCPVKDGDGNCLVSGVFEDSAPIGGA